MADINNTNGGQILSIAWTQLEPDLTVYPSSYVFSSDQDGQHNVNNSVVRLNNNGLMQVSSSQAIKVQCTVTNSNGDVAYDIYEFYVSNSPFIGTFNFSLVNADGSTTSLASSSAPTLKSIDSLIQINLVNWYNSADDTVQKLLLNVYVIKSYSLGQGTNPLYQQYTITGQVSENTIYVRLPPFSVDSFGV